MWPVVMVVADVLIHRALQVTHIERNDMIQEFSPAASDEPLSYSVPPRTAKAGPFRFDPKALDGTDNLCVEIASGVEDQVFGGGIVGNASRSCCETHALVGFRVTPKCNM
jgi:hypothetical protein